MDHLFKSGDLKYGSICQFYQDFDSGEVPLAFPVLASEENQDEIVRSLAKSGVYCPFIGIIISSVQHLRAGFEAQPTYVQYSNRSTHYKFGDGILIRQLAQLQR